MNDTPKRPARPGNIMMGIAAVLFCLVLFSTHLTGGLYARYTTGGQGSDSARVAKFGELTLTESGDFDGKSKKGMIIPGVPLKKDARVSFAGSEVATVVFVEVVPSAGWAEEDNRFFIGSDLSWRVDGNWTRLVTAGYVYYRILAPNTVLTGEPFIADEGTITVSKHITEATIGDLKDTAITLRAGVIQIGAVISQDDLLEAWTTLKARQTP